MTLPELPEDWSAALAPELEQPYFRALLSRLADERVAGPIYPPPDEVFAAFSLTPLSSVRVVILGQDPYHGPGQAHGLAFSVRPGVKLPPSLQNVFKELAADLGCALPSSGSLEGWARQGVLLLNSVLTVRAGAPNSHRALGWERFTDAVIRLIDARPGHVVFVLWGNAAKKKARLVDASKHTLVQGAHPSPLSARLWFGSRPFSAINAALRAHGQKEIDWALK